MVVGLAEARSPIAIQAFAQVFHQTLLIKSLRNLENYLSCTVKMHTVGSIAGIRGLQEAAGVSKVLGLFKSVIASKGVELAGGSLGSEGEGDNWTLNVNVLCTIRGITGFRSISIACKLVQVPYLEKRISEIWLQFH